MWTKHEKQEKTNQGEKERMLEHKILGSIWFPARAGVIGVVAVVTGPDQWRASIGIAYGVNRTIDEQRIAGNGSPLTVDQAGGFFLDLDIEKYKKDEN